MQDGSQIRSPGLRALALTGVVGLHAAALWGLSLQAQNVIPPKSGDPLYVSFVLPRPEPVQPAPALPPAPPRRPELRRIIAAPRPAPAPEPVLVEEPPPATPPQQFAAAAPQAEPAPAPLEPPRFDMSYLDNPAPAYPAMSRKLGEEGQVLLRVLVGVSGEALKVEIDRSSGYGRLDDAAVRAVRRWRFVPARRGDEAVQGWALVPIVFEQKS